MEWQFRRCVESFETYKNTQSLKNDIDRGKPDVATCLIREVQIILNDPNQKIVTKVLSLRFIRDIMILGKTQVINSVEKIIPQLTKICSHRLGQSQPERGQTFFNNRPQYVKGSQTTKKQIQTLASTYFTLSIQSIYTWAKWIPIDQHGNQSLYAKAYNNLLQRDVIFPTKFHYYKPSDTQKFKNTYKVQFFEESASQLTSRMSEVGGSNTSRNHSDLFQIQTQRFSSVREMKQFTKTISSNQTKSEFLSLEFIYNYLKNAELKNQDKKWAKNYVQNYEAVVKNKITYSTFVNNIHNQQIQIQPSFQEYSEIKRQNEIGHRKLAEQKSQHFESSKLRSLQGSKKVQRNNNFHKKQNNSLKGEDEREQIVVYYENRMKQMVKTFENDPQLQILKTENYRLKSQLQQLKYSIPQEQSHIRALEEERAILESNYHILQNQIKNISSENTRLSNLLSLKQKEGNPLQQTVIQLQDQLSKANRKILEYEDKIKKMQKKLVISQEEVTVHKLQLKQEREKISERQNKLAKEVQLLKADKNQIKTQYLQLLGKYDAKVVQQINLKKTIEFQQIKNKNQPSYNHQPLFKASYGKVQENSSAKHHNQVQLSIKKLSSNHYHYLMNEFRSEDRCCLKDKDLILKQSQIQIGMISEVVAGQKIKFILHLTNISDQQIDNLTLSLPKTLMSNELNQFFIFCIQPREQEKIVIYGNYKDINKVNKVSLTYSKKEEIFYRKIMIPLVNAKFINYTKPHDLLNVNNFQSIEFRHTKKMLPKPSYIKSYFKNIEEITLNKIFQVGIQFYATPCKLNLRFQFKDENMLKIDIVGNSILDNQTKLLVQDLLAFMQLVFSK